ncbi:MAG: ABC transporter permease, partial [Pyrinomonadaceae bacterium]
METLYKDIRYAIRNSLKRPGFTAIAVITLALGIGASTAIFSVVYGVLLRSLPYYKPEQIVRVWEVNSKGRQMQFADPNFEDMRDQARSLQGMAEMRSDEAPVSDGDEPDRVRVAYVSKDFFSVMGVQPVMGRLFAPEEQHFGTTRTALVSYSYWQRHLHEATDLGAVKFTVSKNPTAIIGVLPPGFHFPNDSQIWTARETDVRLP